MTAYAKCQYDLLMKINNLLDISSKSLVCYCPWLEWFTHLSCTEESEMVSVLTDLLSTWHKLDSFENKEPQLTCGQVCGAFSILTIDIGELRKIVSSANPGPMVLGAVQKQGEKAMRNKAINSNLPWLLYQLWPSSYCPELIEVGL